MRESNREREKEREREISYIVWVVDGGGPKLDAKNGYIDFLALQCSPSSTTIISRPISKLIKPLPMFLDAGSLPRLF